MKLLYILFLGICFPLGALLQAQSLDKLTNQQLDSTQQQLLKTSDYALSLRYGKAILQRYELSKQQPDSFYLKALVACAKANINTELTDAALVNLTQIQTICEPRQKEFALLYADALNIWGVLYFNKQQSTAALEKILYAQKVLTQTVGKNNMVYAKSAEYLSKCYFYQQGNLEKAEVALLEAKGIAEELNSTNKDMYASVLSDLGDIYRALALHNQAEALYNQALSILEKNNGKENLQYALVVARAAENYMLENKLPRAESTFLVALGIIERKMGKKSLYYYQTQAGLGTVLLRAQKYDEAEKLLIESLQGLRKNKNFISFGYILAQDALGILFIQKKQFDKAEPLLLENMNASREIFGTESALYALQMKNLIYLYTEKKEYDKALTYAMKALDADSKDIDSTATFTDEFIKQLPNNNYYCNEVYMMLIDRFNNLLLAPYKNENDTKWLPQAQLLHQSIFKFLQRLRDQTIVVEDKMTLIQENARIIESAIQVAMKVNNKESMPNIFGIMEQNKMLLLGDALKSRKAQHFGYLPADVANQEEALQTKIDALRKMLRDAPKEIRKDSLQIVLNERNLEMKLFKDKLQKDYPSYFKYKYASAIAQPEKIQKILPPNSALIEYFVADTTIYALRMVAQEMKLFSFPIRKTQLDAQVATLRKVLSDYDYIKKEDPKVVFSLYTQTGEWFYQNLLEPMLQNTDNIKQLVIVADGALGHVPFETFLTEKTTKQSGNYVNLPYLLKKYDISYTYSATLLAENAETTRSNNGKILAMAASYLPSASKQPLASRSANLRNLRASLVDLPSAQKEVEGLKERFKGSFLFKDQATEAQFKKQASEYSIVHLAMHGILETAQPVLSSLAFTENGDSSEDNFLQAWEISHLKLNADLVVLSACETGYGKFQQGEGVMSLARSFMYAGVPSLVISLWSVNDQSTATIMELFYEELQKGKDKSAALRQAKLTYLQNVSGLGAHPAFWAPFVQLGDSQPLATSNQSNTNWWLIGGAGALLLGLVGFFVFRKRV